ncbi:MAG: hypothetical protein ACOCSE_06385 [Chitinivibrionales bacterium]
MRILRRIHFWEITLLCIYLVSTGISGEITIDDCEDGDGYTYALGRWYTFNDNADGGASLVTPHISPEDTGMTPMVSPGFASDYAARIEFSLYQGTMNQYPYTGIGLYTNIDGADLSGMTGLRFLYTGAASRLRVMLSSIADSGHYYINIPSASDWTPFEITWEDLVQPSEADSVPFDYPGYYRFGVDSTG